MKILDFFTYFDSDDYLFAFILAMCIVCAVIVIIELIKAVGVILFIIMAATIVLMPMILLVIKIGRDRR